MFPKIWSQLCNCFRRISYKIIKSMNKFKFIWIPRISAIIFILFISVFALDVFEMERWPLALLIHLIPSFVLVIATAIAWRKPYTGGFVFIILGLTSLIILKSSVLSFLTIIIGGLFLLESSITHTVGTKNRRKINNKRKRF